VWWSKDRTRIGTQVCTRGYQILLLRCAIPHHIPELQFYTWTCFKDEMLKQRVPYNSKLRPRGSGVWIPVEANDLSVLPTVQTGSGANQASYSIGTGVLSLGIGRPARETDHTPPYNAGIKNDWSYLYLYSPLTGKILPFTIS